MKNKVINISSLNTSNDSNDKITETLSKYTEKIVNEDKTVTYTEIHTTYFLENNKWHIDFFGGIEQFKKQVKDYKYSNKNISFNFNNDNINKEMKFIVYSKLFSDEWNLQSTLIGQMQFIRRLSEFINEKYPNVNSFKYLDLYKVNIQWIDWLNKKEIKTITNHNQSSKLLGKEFLAKTPIANFFKNVIEWLDKLTDERIVWERDKWELMYLKQYGINYSESNLHSSIDFTKISNLKIREEVKKYIKQRLIANNHFSWGSASEYLNYLPPFINYICEESEPSWDDLKGLERKHIEKYIEYLHIHAKENLKQKNANPKSYIGKSLTIIQKFLSDIQIREYDIAPIKNVRILIYPDDKPKVPKKPVDQIDYITDFVLEQLFENINNLHKEVVPIVYVMFKTGLRVSDAVELKQNCLIRLNGKYWIETDIDKVDIKNHRIPIDDELANMLAVLIDRAKKYSNDDNNPNRYIFVRYNGSRKGRPYSSVWIQKELNLFDNDYNITDESGKIYHFKNHAFRHTCAIKLLNSGVDILVVQEILGHASPEMTLRYAKLLDDTKRKAFDEVVKKGIFHFDERDKLVQENDGEIPEKTIEMLYTNYKLNAIDTPYGTCMQRKNGKCTFAKQPPCLTCNSGKPCKDLCIGAFEGDINKYEILITSTTSTIETAKMYDRPEMIKENEELLKLYKNIHSTILGGSLIYGRLDKLKKEGEKYE